MKNNVNYTLWSSQAPVPNPAGDLCQNFKWAYDTVLWIIIIKTVNKGLHFEKNLKNLNQGAL